MLTRARELAPSIVRTVTPYVVGILITLLGKAGFEWEPSPEALVLVTAAVSAGYYALVRILETRGVQAWGWLLGLPKAPEYDATVVDTPTGEVATRNSDLPTGAPVETRRIHNGSGLPDTQYVHDPKLDRP